MAVFVVAVVGGAIGVVGRCAVSLSSSSSSGQKSLVSSLPNSGDAFSKNLSLQMMRLFSLGPVGTVLVVRSGSSERIS